MEQVKSTHTLVGSNITRYIVPLIILSYLVITVILAKITNVWIDEAYSLHTTQYDIKQTLISALNFEKQSPLYFIILNIWRNVNDSFYFARLLSVICMIVSLIVVAKISRKLVKDMHPGWITAVVAFNPFVIEAAIEIRCYALVFLFSALLCFFFMDAYLTDEPNVRAKWFYILFSIVSLYTFYYLGFLLVANAISLIILKRWRSLKSYFINMIFVGICFLPMIVFISDHLFSRTETVKSEVPILYGLQIVSHRILDVVLPTGGYIFEP